jgi:FKBP-type peptidyl-prolyl cis-trans isomerase
VRLSKIAVLSACASIELMSGRLLSAQDGIIQTNAQLTAPLVVNARGESMGFSDVSQASATSAASVPHIETVPSPLISAEFASLMPSEGLNGWVVQEGKPSAWRRDGEMISCTSSTGGWLRTEKAYSDFELRLEYRLQAGGNTGIGLRAPAFGNPTFNGLEIQLLDDAAGKYANLRPDQYTGSVYYQVPAGQKASVKAPGEWNICEITCLGDLLRVKINGETVNEVQLNRYQSARAAQADVAPRFSLAERPPVGHIALQSHSTQVDFRNIALRDLTVTTASGLQYADLVLGEGQTANTPAQVTVHYVGQLLDGKRFTDTHDLGTPVTVPLAAVIPGWQEGLQGMKVGGRRRLIVPPALAYGAQGAGDLIPPDTTLVFEIELCDLQP